MPIATVCPKCNSMFRTPVEALQRADGTVQCGECKFIFVALKHALLLDAPIVERVSNRVVHINARRSRTGFIFSSLIFAFGLVSILCLHTGLVKNAFSLHTVQAIAPMYTILGADLPLYRGVDGFVLGQSALKKEEDQSIALDFVLYNRGNVPTAWPRLKITLLGPKENVVYEIVRNVEDLLASKTASSAAPELELALNVRIATTSARHAISYKLELIEQ